MHKEQKEKKKKNEIKNYSTIYLSYIKRNYTIILKL